jgi:hypothetical protein
MFKNLLIYALVVLMVTGGPVHKSGIDGVYLLIDGVIKHKSEKKSLDSIRIKSKKVTGYSKHDEFISKETVEKKSHVKKSSKRRSGKCLWRSSKRKSEKGIP